MSKYPPTGGLTLIHITHIFVPLNNYLILLCNVQDVDIIIPKKLAVV